MTVQHYDAIFVGQGLTSLAAAAVLAKNGKSVLLLDGDAAAAQNSPNDTFKFSLGPCLYFGYEKWGAMEGFFSKLAYPIPSLQKKGFSFQKVTPMVQVVLPKHRISLHTDEESYFDELAREFAPLSQNLKTLFGQISREAAFYYPQVGQFPQVEIEGVADRINEWKKAIDYAAALQQHQKGTAIEFLHPHSLSSDVFEYLNLIFMWAYHKPLESGSTFELLQLFYSLQKGAVCFPEGYPTLVSFFHHLIKVCGGTILKGKVSAISDPQNLRIKGIALADGSKVSSAHIVVAQPSEKKRVDFYFTLPKHLIPEPMKDTVLMTWGQDLPKNVEDLLVIRMNPVTEESQSSKERLMVVSVLLQSENALSETTQEYLKNRILERLYWVIPFSESEMKVVENPQKTEAAARPFLLRSECVGTSKEVMKGVLTYLQPKAYKNVYLVDSEETAFIAWGAPFLAGHRLSGIIEKSA